MPRFEQGVHGMVVQIDKSRKDDVVGVDVDGILFCGELICHCGNLLFLDYDPSLAEDLVGSNNSTADDDSSILRLDYRAGTERDQADNYKPPGFDLNHGGTSVWFIHRGLRGLTPEFFIRASCGFEAAMRWRLL